ncbi:MAG: pilus assembly protein PilC [Actinobacteria bacterium RBG_16_70_17]|nr:MAG: pilus assembly protein PilC [Actinobacteria bacterium RBG_16_70_17]
MSPALTFEYRARDRSGTVREGQLEASSAAAVARTLQEKGMVPLRVAERRVAALDRELKIPRLGKKVKPKAVAIFSRQLATMVNSGLTLVRALTVLHQQTENPALAKVVGDVRARVEQGSSLSAALAEHPKIFGYLYVSMIQAGEVSGALDETLLRLAETLESAARLRSKVRSAMAYPAVVMSLVVLVVSAMMLFIVPIFERIYNDLGGKLPFPTQVLISISDILGKAWWAGALVIILAVFGFRRWVATDDGRHAWDGFKLKMPVFGKLVKKVALSRFARTMAVLSRTGVPVLQALDIVSETSGNALISDAVRDVRDAVKRGESLASPLSRHDVFPPMVVQMMTVGEETGALDTMLSKVSEFYDQEVDDAVSALVSLIEPLLIMVMGVVVGGILICLYLPMFNIGSLIQ